VQEKILAVAGRTFDYVYLTIWSVLNIRGDSAFEREVTAAMVMTIPVQIIAGTALGRISGDGVSILSNQLTGTLLLAVPIILVFALTAVLRSRWTLSAAERFRVLRKSSSTIVRVAALLAYFAAPILFLILTREAQAGLAA